METDFRRNKFFSFAKKNLLLGIVLLVGIFSISNALTKEVIIRDEDKEINIKGYISSVGDALDKAKIALGEHDQIGRASCRERV